MKTSHLLECIINTSQNIKVKVQTYSFRDRSIASYLVPKITEWQKRLVFYCTLNARSRSVLQINLRVYRIPRITTDTINLQDFSHGTSISWQQMLSCSVDTSRIFLNSLLTSCEIYPGVIVLLEYFHNNFSLRFRLLPKMNHWCCISGISG